jgi:hypothetical protein
MIPFELLNALNDDLYGNDKSSARYIVALIDMATIPEDTQQKLTNNLDLQLHPLLLARGFEKLRPLGAHLVSSNEATRMGHSALFDKLSPYDSNEIVAWITSTVSPEVLAQHLSQATFANTENGEQYLLRYYDSHVTPTLLHHAPEQWQNWLLAPIVSWWFRGATSHHEQWHRIRGRAHSTPIVAAPRLLLSTKLWHSLESDSLPHRLLQILNKTMPALFNSPCQGVRLALIESLLARGKSLGLIEHYNLIDFVILNLQNTPDQLQGNASWHLALQRSVNGEGRLSRLYRHGEQQS